MLNNKIKIQCPAKINLTLKVMNKREDGFHNIDSVMQTINLFDYLTINVEKSEKFEIKLSGNSDKIPYDEKNLVYKAVKMFVDNVKIPFVTINIYIEKNIPIAAGLAGGSTDAAGTLYGLNKLFNEPLNHDDLHKLCAKLGSDLNFCLEGGCQRTTGRGEILEQLPFEEFNLSLIKPINLGISAKEAYTKFADKKNPKCDNDDASTCEDCSKCEKCKFTENNNSAIKNRKEFANDLEWAVIDDYLELKIIKNIYPKALMSGSGSTYFIINDEFDKMDGCWVKNGLEAISYGVKEI